MEDACRFELLLFEALEAGVDVRLLCVWLGFTGGGGTSGASGLFEYRDRGGNDSHADSVRAEKDTGTGGISTLPSSLNSQHMRTSEKSGAWSEVLGAIFACRAQSSGVGGVGTGFLEVLIAFSSESAMRSGLLCVSSCNRCPSLVA